MPNDARIEELIAQVVQHDGGKTTVHERLREALRTAMREAREGQLIADIERCEWTAGNCARAGLKEREIGATGCATLLRAQLPTKKG